MEGLTRSQELVVAGSEEDLGVFVLDGIGLNRPLLVITKNYLELQKVRLLPVGQRVTAIPGTRVPLELITDVWRSGYGVSFTAKSSTTTYTISHSVSHLTPIDQAALDEADHLVSVLKGAVNARRG